MRLCLGSGGRRLQGWLCKKTKRTEGWLHRYVALRASFLTIAHSEDRQGSMTKVYQVLMHTHPSHTCACHYAHVHLVDHILCMNAYIRINMYMYAYVYTCMHMYVYVCM